MADQNINVAIIGARRIGLVHAENLAFRIPAANPLSIADIDENAARNVARRCRIPKAVRDYHDLLSDPAIHAVIICSSTDTHANIICEAAAAGKHIFCEKPIDHSLAKIDRALAAVDQAGVKLQIGFNRRFDPNFARVHRAISQGEIGEPHRLHIISRDPEPPPVHYVKVSGGIFLDMTIHDFDMARFLIGNEVDEIYASGGVRIDPEIAAAGDLDTALVVLKFKNGVIGSIDNSRKAVYGYDQRVEVFGSAGAIETGNNFPNAAIISSKNAVCRDLPLNFFMERYTESFVVEMQAFVDAIGNDTATAVNGMDGRFPVVMALAARKSYDENRPVKLSEIEG